MSSSVEPRPNGLNGLKRKTYETLDYRSLVYAKNQLDSLWKRVRDGNPNDTIILQAAHNASKSGYFHITFTTYMYHCDEKTLKVESFRKCFFTAKGFALKLTDECDLEWTLSWKKATRGEAKELRDAVELAMNEQQAKKSLQETLEDIGRHAQISDTEPFDVATVNRLHEQYILEFVADHRTIELVKRLPNKVVLQFKPMADLEWVLEPAQLPRELESIIIGYL